MGKSSYHPDLNEIKLVAFVLDSYAYTPRSLYVLSIESGLIFFNLFGFHSYSINFKIDF